MPLFTKFSNDAYGWQNTIQYFIYFLIFAGICSLFLFKKEYDTKKIRYILLDKPFPKNTDRWQNQAIQRDYILENLDFVSEEDFIFFSDPDEIIRPELLINFNLKKKYFLD